MKILSNHSSCLRFAASLGERYSGRTFRHLMFALGSASSGKSVVYCVQSQSMVRWTYKKAISICGVYFTYTEREEDNIIRFPGGGSVKFTTTNSLREAGNVIKVEDLS